MKTLTASPRTYPPLTAWSVAPGIVWVQANEPATARALKRITGAKRVAYSVGGRYLQTFEFHKPLSWAKHWIARHRGTNEAFFDLAACQSHFNSAPRSREPQALQATPGSKPPGKTHIDL